MQILDRIASELAYLKGSLRILGRISPIAKNPTYTICDLMQETAAKFGDRVALISDRETLTFRQYDAPRQPVCPMGQGARDRQGRRRRAADAEPAGLPLRLAGRGARRRRDGADQHEPHRPGAGAFDRHRECEGRDRRRATSCPPSGRDAVHPEPGRIMVHSGGAGGLATASTTLANYADADLASDERTPLTIEDRCVFVYTSGTTGLPKAANINHYRVMAMAKGFSALMDTEPDDRMYDCLPMYHSNGGILATCGTLVQGGSVVIREQLLRAAISGTTSCATTARCSSISASSAATSSTPRPARRPQAQDPRSPAATGSAPTSGRNSPAASASRNQGVLRRNRRQHRDFQPGRQPGAIGRIPKWAERRFVVKVQVRHRDTKSRCAAPTASASLRAGRGGEIIGQILNDPAKPANRFEGYADRAATERKILRDAFEKGDAWFRSGDLMKKDKDGYFYFIDRVGDTFRWKGENVATSEVAEALTAFPGIATARSTA